MKKRSPSTRRLALLLPALLGLWLTLNGCTSTPEALPEETVVEAVGTPAWVDDAVIYEIFVPDFTEAGTFRAIIPRLNGLKEMGVTTLWLMPIHPIGIENRKGDLGSPYAIRDYYALNPDYGTEEDFRALVEAVHAHGMYLIIDFVANHTAWDHPWTQAHPEWYTRDADGNISVPLDPEGRPTDWTDVADLNYDNPELRAEMIQVMRYWVETFDIDGYRCDVAGWVPYDFWAEAITALRAVKPVLMLAENEDPAIHAAGFDLTYAWPFYQQLKAVWAGAPVAELVALVEETEAALPADAKRLRFTTNHDETAWDATPPALFGGQAGAQAAFVAATAVPGVPLLYNGQETGIEEPVPFFSRTPYDWTARPEVQDVYTRYLNLYGDSEALRRGRLTFPAPEAEDVLLLERATEDERVLVAVNVRDRAAAIAVPPAYRDVALTDAATGTAVTLGERLELPPYGYRLLRAVE